MEVVQSPNKSIRNIARNLTLSHMSVSRLMKDAGLRSFRSDFVQKLSEDDKIRRTAFCLEWLDKLEWDSGIEDLTLWTDEATFKLDGMVNKRNWVTHDYENPHTQVEVPQKAPGLSVWLGVHSGGLIGPFFFNKTVTGDTYLTMLKNDIIPSLMTLPQYNQILFMQDGAPPHWSLAVREFLGETFGANWIGRDGPIQWPPRSPDLTPCDFFLWGFLKDLVYRKKPRSLNELRQSIIDSCSQITKEMCKKACQSVKVRLENCVGKEGGAVPSTRY